MLWGTIYFYEKNTFEPPHKYQWWLDDINWSYHQAKLSPGTTPVKIAIIDTGIDSTHPDLLGSVAEEFSVVGSQENLPDDFEHGTSIAGIIAGMPSSKHGIQGIAPYSCIYSIDVSTSTKKIQIFDLVSAIEKAIELNVDIINISMGTPQNDPALHKAIQKAYKNGIIIVASIGNDVSQTALYPAMYDEVLAVGSLSKRHDELYGQPFLKGVVYLPGENILTTYSSPATTNKTISQSGTSLSTPILTGIIALVLQKDPTIPAESIYEYFLSSESHKWDLHMILSNF